MTAGNRLAAAIWAFITALLIVFLGMRLPHTQVSSDIFELLPQTRVLPQVQEAFLGRLDTRIVIASNDRKVFDELTERLSSLAAVDTIRARLTEAQKKEYLQETVRYAPAMLSDAMLRSLSVPESYVRKVVAQIYSPIAAPGKSELELDPLLLARSILKGRKKQDSVFESDGYLSVKDDQGTIWSLGFITLKSGLTNSEKSHFVSAYRALESRIKTAHPDALICTQGAVFYAVAAAESARTDITILGSVSLLLLIGLFAWTFGSVRPILLCLLSASVGTAAGLASCLYVFDGIHGIPLVMCVSLIGLSTDYTTYYLMSLRDKCGCPAWEVMKTLRPSLLHAVLTTAIAYGLMFIAPFPGLRQLALFAVTGLSAACLTTIFWFPMLVGGIRVKHTPLAAFSCRYQSLWQNKQRYIKWMLVICTCCAVVGLNKLQINDSLLVLQEPPQQLVADEEKIASLLGQNFTQSGLLVDAADEEQLLGIFDDLKKRGVSSDSIPPLRSPSVQNKAVQYIYAAEETVRSRLQKLGIHPGEFRYSAIGLKEYLASSLGEAYRPMFLEYGERIYAWIPAVNVQNGLPDGVHLVDRRGEIELAMKSYRVRIMELLCAAFLLVLVSFACRFGWRSAVGAGLCLGFAATASLTALGIAGLPLNLFAVFALILVLGIGIDYIVFFTDLSTKKVNALEAMTIAVASSLISLGILIFSRTDAVQGFGLALSAGVAAAFCIAPLMLWWSHDKH